MRYFSLRMKLDDIIKDVEFEQLVLENIRRCRDIAGKKFKVIFWHDSLTPKICEEFVIRNEHLLFQIHTQITQKFEDAWFVIDSKGEKSNWRYMHEGDILTGIVSYINLVKHMVKKEN